ncbi:hypothetical protein DKG34_21975 [Streptomyces sp. NWU49]|nr:hypothetical protein DKG34_21975 [Streptomyces sp. NWU49]
MLDLVDMPARDHQAMDPAGPRHAGLAYALKVPAQPYAEHPHYRQEGRPWAYRRDSPLTHRPPSVPGTVRQRSSQWFCGQPQTVRLCRSKS